jgi:class 3 adenylate cyclase
MEDLDPEEARAIIDPALKLMVDAVRRHNGYVVQSTGDGIFALFGAPLAYEDHPQRALYAAMRMRDELRRYSARLVADDGNPIQGRIGVNSGEIVVRNVETGDPQVEYTPIGHMVNLASRMQAVAPIGSIAAADSTRKLCEGYFMFAALGPTRMRGVSEPVEVHEVTGLGQLKTRLQAAMRRGLSRFVGRDAELAQMKRALELVRNGHGQIVAMIGEPGPVVTMYKLELGEGVKVSQIVNLADDLSLALRAASVRIQAPIPGEAVVGIEVPNRKREKVYLREMLEAKEFKASASQLTIALGKDIAGCPVWADLAAMPHLLIAGATGTGKSVSIHAMVASILFKATADDVRFILIDPKMLELSVYEGIPHLLVPVVVDLEKSRGCAPVGDR